MSSDDQATLRPRWKTLKHFERLFLFVVATISLMTLSCSAFALTPPPLTIDLKAKTSQGLPGTRDLRAAWSKACRTLGEALIAGQGPWGFGAFGNIRCTLDGKVVARLGKGPSFKGSWRLTVAQNADNLTMTLINGFNGAKNFVESQIQFPAAEQNVRFLSDPEFADLVALALLDASPLAIYVGSEVGKEISRRYPRVMRGKARFSIPDPYESLVFYEVDFIRRRNLWKPKLLGTSSRSEVVVPRGDRDGKVSYEIERGLSSAWAHATSGPGERQKEWLNAVVAAHKRLQSAANAGYLDQYMAGEVSYFTVAIADSASSGFVGARYGLQVLSGEGLLKDTSFFGALFEVRGGPASGLRYYYDLLPRTTQPQDFLGADVDLFIGWSRHVLGFSFGFELDWFINWIDFIPKVGILNFEANLATKRDEDNNLTAFQLFEAKNTLNLVGDIGFERRGSFYTLRLWYSLSAGPALSDEQSSVLSNNVGFDAFFKVGPELPIFGQDFQLALLAFYAYESVTLTAPKKEPAQVIGVEAGPIKSVNYVGGYAGGGLALSW